MNITLKHNSNKSAEVKSKDLNAKKILIADKLISFYVPILNEDSERKSRQIKKLEQDFKKIASTIKSANDSVKSIESQILYEQLIRRVLVETQRLFGSDILYGSLKDLIVKTLTRLNNNEVISNEEFAKIIKILSDSTNKIKKVIV